MKFIVPADTWVQARVPAHCLNRTGYFLASAM